MHCCILIDSFAAAGHRRKAEELAAAEDPLPDSPETAWNRVNAHKRASLHLPHAEPAAANDGAAAKFGMASVDGQ